VGAARSNIVLGVDGCPGGWIGARVRSSDSRQTLIGFQMVDRLEELTTDPQLRVIAVDMPIGLPGAEGTRACDVEARKVLRPCGSRVFPAPVRATLPHAGDYPAACAASREECGKALSKQGWNILGKIAEADELADDPRLVECHPEVAFALMGDGVIAASKKTAAGRIERISRLRHWLPDLADTDLPRGDDALDALACAWSAVRYAEGRAQQWPAEAPRDGRGRPMRIIA
jgi:predicted RNase H-like nuclease